MSVSGNPKTTPIHRLPRVALALLGIGLVALLVIALVLTPNREGYGTHEQLGLPPCTMVVLFGRRCPSCGMTTSWAHLVRGRALEAIDANAGGTLLGLAAMAAAPWSLASAIRGRWVWGKPTAWAFIATMAVIAGVTVLQWLTCVLV